MGRGRTFLKDGLALSGIFVLSRVLFLAAGIRFDAAPLGSYWQFLDPRLLEGDLLRSLFYLHSQPPLFNLFLGLVLKLSPVAPAAALHAVYATAGLCVLLSTFAVMRGLGVARRWAALVSTLLVVRPSFVLFESWLTYDLPVTFLLCMAAFWLVLSAQLEAELFVHAFFLTVAAVCATRSLFHPVYFFAVAALIAASRFCDRKTLLRATALPALFLMLLMAKNFVLFGQFGTSTWLGMNLWRIASTELEAGEIEALRERGELSDVAAVKPFARLGSYPARYLADLRHPAVPAVAAPLKSTRASNYNHEAYIRISRSYLKDALWVIRHRPGDYLLGVGKAWYYYFSPPSLIVQVRENRARIQGYAGVVETFFYGRLPGALRYGGVERPFFLFATLGISALLLYAAFSVARGERSPPSRAVLAFLLLTTLYVAGVGNSLEVVENQRFRFCTDPFMAVFLARAVQRFFPGESDKA